MRKILLAVILLFSMPVFSQVKTPCEKDVSRLNQMMNALLEQNERLKKENIYLKGEVLSENKTTIKSTTKTTAIGKIPLAELAQSIEAKMVGVQGGSFNMGCGNEKDTACYYWEKPGHTVTLNNFYISKYDVTQREWEAVMDSNPCYSHCDECPVVNISWDDAQAFIGKLNQLSDKHYRLPTEAEWEYAAKGGNKSKVYKYAGDNNINTVAWYAGNSNKQTHPVGQKQPNELGLYDMSGNVWQWCFDWFDDKYYSKSNASNNPKGPEYGNDYRACRGGSWWYAPNDCRSSNRDRYPPDGRDDDVGFRLARD